MNINAVIIIALIIIILFCLLFLVLLIMPGLTQPLINNIDMVVLIGVFAVAVVIWRLNKGAVEI
jgi:hypothetical protein